MWKEYFGKNAKIYGVDIHEACRAFADERTQIFIGDQADRSFWAEVKHIAPSIDIVIDDGGHKRFFEFFTVPIRNKNTRVAYYHAISQFLDWCQRYGFRHLEDIEPITVAAYLEQHAGSPATIKQHMAATRMMFSWLTEKDILAMNPSRMILGRAKRTIFSVS